MVLAEINAYINKHRKAGRAVLKPTMDSYAPGNFPAVLMSFACLRLVFSDRCSFGSPG